MKTRNEESSLLIKNIWDDRASAADRYAEKCLQTNRHTVPVGGCLGFVAGGATGLVLTAGAEPLASAAAATVGAMGGTTIGAIVGLIPPVVGFSACYAASSFFRSGARKQDMQDLESGNVHIPSPASL